MKSNDVSDLIRKKLFNKDVFYISSFFLRCTNYIFFLIKNKVRDIKKFFYPSKIYSSGTYLVLNHHLRGNRENNMYSSYIQLLRLIPSEYPNKNFNFVLDLGSHIGGFIIPAINNNIAKRGLAVEPMPNNLRYINASARLNNIENKLIVLSGAVNATDQPIEISVGPSSTTSSISSLGFHLIKEDLEKRKEKKYVKSNKGQITVQGFSFSTILEKFSNEEKSDYLLKIDIEGGEHIVLSDILGSNWKPNTIIGELHPSDIQDLEVLINQIKANYSYHHFISCQNGCYEFVCSGRK